MPSSDEQMRKRSDIIRSLCQYPRSRTGHKNSMSTMSTIQQFDKNFKPNQSRHEDKFEL